MQGHRRRWPNYPTILDVSMADSRCDGTQRDALITFDRCDQDLLPRRNSPQVVGVPQIVGSHALLKTVLVPQLPVLLPHLRTTPRRSSARGRNSVLGRHIDMAANYAARQRKCHPCVRCVHRTRTFRFTGLPTKKNPRRQPNAGESYEPQGSYGTQGSPAQQTPCIGARKTVAGSKALGNIFVG
jgi:hypothetical protein